LGATSRWGKEREKRKRENKKGRKHTERTGEKHLLVTALKRETERTEES